MLGLALLLLCVSQTSHFQASFVPTTFAAKRSKKATGLHHIPWRSLVYRLRWNKRTYQERLAQELRRRKELRALPYLLGMLRNTRKKSATARRQGALIALGQLAIPWTLALLQKALQDKESAVRWAAAEALGSFCREGHCEANDRKRTQDIVQTLLGMVKNAPKEGVKAALWGLSSIEDKAALLPLKRLYKSGQSRPGTGLHFSRALAALGDQDKRSTWQKLSHKRPTWTARQLSRWPGRWHSQLLYQIAMRASKGRKMRRILRQMERLDTPTRRRLLRRACQKNRPGPKTCKALRKRLKAKDQRFPAVPAPFFLLPASQIQKAQQGLTQLSFGKRLVALSDRMLGTPYVLDPLGEGKKGRYDKDPIFSFRRVDCVTFVEQVIGLAHTPSLKAAIRYTQSIRYDKGKIDYRYRKHLPIAQWIPSMIQMGLARDVTRQIGKEQTLEVNKTIDRKSYSTREGRRLIRRLGRRRVVYGRFTLPYLTMDVALARLKEIPSGTVVSTLRPHNPYSPGQVTHQGMLIRKGGVLYMRHASSLWRSVVDVPFGTYLRILKKYPRPRIGVHLLQLLPPQKTR